MKHHGRLKRPLSPSEQAASDHNRRQIDATAIVYAAQALEKQRKADRSRRLYRDHLRDQHQRFARDVYDHHQDVRRVGDWLRLLAADDFRAYCAYIAGIGIDRYAIARWWYSMHEWDHVSVVRWCRAAHLDEVEQIARNEWLDRIKLG